MHEHIKLIGGIQVVKSKKRIYYGELEQLTVYVDPEMYVSLNSLFDEVSAIKNTSFSKFLRALLRLGSENMYNMDDFERLESLKE